MFKKMKEISKQPITWGQYGKLCGWAFLIYGIGVVVYCFAIIDSFRDRVADGCQKILNKIAFWKRWER